MRQKCMKKRILALLLIIALLSLTACTKHYGRNDIKTYVREELGLKGFTVSRTCKDIIDDEGYTVYTLGKKHGTIFLIF